MPFPETPSYQRDQVRSYLDTQVQDWRRKHSHARHHSNNATHALIGITAVNAVWLGMPVIAFVVTVIALDVLVGMVGMSFRYEPWSGRIFSKVGAFVYNPQNLRFLLVANCVVYGLAVGYLLVSKHHERGIKQKLDYYESYSTLAKGSGSNISTTDLQKFNNLAYQLESGQIPTAI